LRSFQYILFTFLFIGLYVPVLAQYDSLYINTYKDKFYIKPIFSVRSAEVELKGKFDGFENVRYIPNGNSYYGLGIYILGINFELSTKFPSSWQRPTEIYGYTNSFDLQANIYTRKIGVDLSFQLYDGFYLDKPKRHIATWQVGDVYPQRDDLTYENLHLNVFYVFNHKRFSFRSSYNQSEEQLKSAGSPILSFTFADVKISANETLFPNETLVPEVVKGFNYADYITYAVLGGYGYNFLYKDFYANLTLSLGLGIQNREIRPNFVEKNRILTGVSNLRVAIGYNTDFFFAGISTVNQFTSTNLGDVDLNVGTSNFKLFLGLRFKEKMIFKRNK